MKIIVVGCLLLFGVVATAGYFIWTKFLREDAKGVVGNKVLVAKNTGRAPETPPAGSKAPARPITRIVRNQPAPEIEGIDSDGEKFKLSDYRGKVVVLDFWAGW